MGHDMTERDIRIIGLINCGADTAVIEHEIGMNAWTLRDRIRKLRKRLGADTMLDLPERARALGIVLPECTDEWVDLDAPEDESEEADDGTIRVDGVESLI